MKKYITLFLLLIFVSCSHQNNLWSQSVASTWSFDDRNVRQIIGFMEIINTDPEYPMVYEIISRSEKSCIWKDFIGYRECFIKNLVDSQKNYQITEKLDNILSIFRMSLAEEISSIDLYKEIDMLRVFWIQNIGWTCIIGWYRTFDQGAFTGQSVVLSYWDSQKELSHTLSKSRNLKPKSLSWILLHENPCEFHTWWPDVWHIFYFSQVWKNNYFFIKTSDGWWSGDFNYTVYWNHTEWKNHENEYKPIATFPAYSWLTPIPQIMRDEEWSEVAMLHRNIIEEYKNQPFQYVTEFENQRTGYIYQIVSILTDTTPWIILD